MNILESVRPHLQHPSEPEPEGIVDGELDEAGGEVEDVGHARRVRERGEADGDRE